MTNTNKPIPPIAQDSCRAAFEAWYTKGEDWTPELGIDGDYLYEVARDAWGGWQAAWNARPVETGLKPEAVSLQDCAKSISRAIRVGSTVDVARIVLDTAGVKYSEGGVGI